MSRIASFLRNTGLWIILFPIACSFVGAASNQLVLWANNDTFPVKVNLVKLQKIAGDAARLPDGTIMLDDIHCLMTNRTHLNILADNWDVHDGIESIGDMLIDFGGWLWNFCPFVWGAAVIARLKDAVY